MPVQNSLSSHFCKKWFKRTEDHLVSNKGHEIYQSVYRVNHKSTETAFLKVQLDVVSLIPTRVQYVLLVLEFPADIDLIDHSILIDCLKYFYGIPADAFWRIKILP